MVFHSSMFPWAQGLLATDLTCAVQGVHLMVTETRVRRSEFKLLFSARFLRRQQWHQVWDSSRNCAHTDGVVESASWGSVPGLNTYSWTCNVQTEVKDWFQRRLHLRMTLDCSAINLVVTPPLSSKESWFQCCLCVDVGYAKLFCRIFLTVLFDWMTCRVIWI